MPEPFVTVPLATEAPQLLDLAIERLEQELEAKGVVGWEPNEAALEMIILGVVSYMAANAATVAATVLPAIFRKYGTELLNLPFNEGTNATASTKWKLLEEAGEFPARTIEAGTQLEGSGFAFYVEKAVSVAKGTNEVTITVVAAERGVEYNGISGVLQLVNSSNFISTVTITGESAGGLDQETDEQYLNRLVAVLALQAPRPITAANFAELTLVIPTATLPAGTVIQRATAIDGYNPETITIEAKTNSSTELTEVEPEAGSVFTGVSLAKSGGAQSHPGSLLHWHAEAAEKYTVLPKGTTAVVRLGAHKLEISKAALKSEAKGKVDVIGKYEEPRCTTVFVYFHGEELGITETERAANTSAKRAAVKAYLEERRELNFKVFVEPASFNEVQVKGSVHVLPGFTESSVVANVKAAVEAFLSPEKWGNPEGATTGSQTWLNATQGANVVRYNQLIGVMEAVKGVQYVPAGSSGLAIGLGEAPGTKTADLTLVGPAPLPEAVSVNVTITAV